VGQAIGKPLLARVGQWSGGHHRHV
jgi:hypothetical protein